MKKTLKIVVLVFAGLLVLILLGATYVHLKGIPAYEPQHPVITIPPADSLTLAHGKRLTVLVCANCHQGPDGRLSGNLMEDIPASFGTVWSQNITRHPTKGLGRYTDGELVYLLRTGIKRDGNYAPAWMPKFPLMSDDDMYAIIAFLRSDDKLTEPVAKLQAASQPSFLVKALTHTVMKPLPYPQAKIARPPVTDQIALGQYLADGVYACYSCHSADFTQLDELNPTASTDYYGGGTLLLDPTNGQEVYSANLTPHATGLQDWTLEEFSAAVRFAQGKDKIRLNIMPPHGAMTEAEVAAIWAYLRTVPAIEKEVALLGK